MSSTIPTPPILNSIEMHSSKESTGNHASANVPGVNRLIRSITFTGPSPEIHVPREVEAPGTSSGGASPLLPPSSSIRHLRLASHSPLVQRRESFGAKDVPNNDPEYRTRPRYEKLLVPGEDPMHLGKGNKGRKEISKSFHAFVPTSDHNDKSHSGADFMKSAIISNIGHQVADSDDRLGSHDMMSLTSRFTEAASSDQDDSYPNPTEVDKDVEYWKELNVPAKNIRSMRFSFNRATSSNMDPADIFRELTITLNKLNRQRSNNLTFSRNNPDYYLLICKFRNPFSTVDDPVIFEVEVCKVWLLKIHGLRIKRIAGSPLLFKELYVFLETELKIS